jgi:bifunctional UDP-N-acetylglucosamine pyrophosphorylase/glucosamine-1-phosphate N-acetyltransferase
MERGGAISDIGSTLIGPGAEIGRDCVIYPSTIIRGKTRIGEGCAIGPNTVLEDATVGKGCVVNASQLYRCSVGEKTTVGPFAYIRPDTTVGDHGADRGFCRA